MYSLSQYLCAWRRPLLAASLAGVPAGRGAVAGPGAADPRDDKKRDRRRGGQGAARSWRAPPSRAQAAATRLAAANARAARPRSSGSSQTRGQVVAAQVGAETARRKRAEAQAARRRRAGPVRRRRRDQRPAWTGHRVAEFVAAAYMGGDLAEPQRPDAARAGRPTSLDRLELRRPGRGRPSSEAVDGYARRAAGRPSSVQNEAGAAPSAPPTRRRLEADGRCGRRRGRAGRGRARPSGDVAALVAQRAAGAARSPRRSGPRACAALRGGCKAESDADRGELRAWEARRRGAAAGAGAAARRAAPDAGAAAGSPATSATGSTRTTSVWQLHAGVDIAAGGGAADLRGRRPAR